jgi:hypothetical protein
MIYSMVAAAMRARLQFINEKEEGFARRRHGRCR